MSTKQKETEKAEECAHLAERPASELQGYDLEWSTIVPEERKHGQKSKAWVTFA